MMIRDDDPGARDRLIVTHVGRTVRDEEGHIFYVIADEAGDGHYASLTRKGGPEQKAKYLEMIAKQEHARSVGAERSAEQIHDATGKRRSGGRCRRRSRSPCRRPG